MTEAALVRRADVLWRDVLDEVLIRRRGDDQPILVTGSGAALWRALAEPSTIADLAARLAAEHGTDPARLAPEIETVVSDLVERGVVVVR